MRRARGRRHVHQAVRRAQEAHPVDGRDREVQFCRCGASRMVGESGRPIVGGQLGRWRNRGWRPIDWNAHR